MVSAKRLIEAMAERIIRAIRNGWKMDREIDDFNYWYNWYMFDYNPENKYYAWLNWEGEYEQEAANFLNKLAGQKMFKVLVNYEGHYFFIREISYVPEDIESEI